MPMVMPFEAAWEKLVRERVNVASDIAILTKADIESVTGNELRLMAKIDSSDDLPRALRQHGYFILPVKNGEYALVRGNGFHVLEALPEPASVFRPKLDFELNTLEVGDSEPQHLDRCFNIGLIEKFAGVTGLCQTIHGRKRLPAFEFFVGNVGPIRQSGVQAEVDLGCEGRTDIVLIEAKVGQPADFIVRQLFYPYRMWKHEIPGKVIRPWFFCTMPVGEKRLYKFWQYRFADDGQYGSLVLERSEAFLVEPERKRLTVDELLREHHRVKSQRKLWNIPQADSFWRVADLPLLITQGINDSGKLASHYKFDPRQSSYYRQAAEFLDLVRLEKSNRYVLTDLGRDFVTRTADERRKILAGLLAGFPPMRAALDLSAQKAEKGIGKREVAAMIAAHSAITSSTPLRRASTLLAWMKWLKSATGALDEDKNRFSPRL
jgi:hypothetical protein